MSEPVNDVVWELLDALRQAQFARGVEEIQDSRFEVEGAADKLRKILSDIEDAKP